MHPLEVQLAKCFSWLHRGNTYHCNLCGFQSKSLRTRGHAYPVLESKNVLSSGKRHSDCPHCLSSDRDRLVWLYLSKHLEKDLRILHVAPELPIANAIRNHPSFSSIHYECIDKKTKGYYYPSWVKQGDITALGYPSHHFDIIIANHVLEHIVDLSTALAELRRVLKPTGVAIFMVPMSTTHPTDDGCTNMNNQSNFQLLENECISRFGQRDHVRLFGNDMSDILSLHKWKITFINPIDLAPNEKELELLGLFPGEQLIIGHPIE
ncbi:MAG: class I SAM-dependent methyltransferase [Bacteroidota bacterium]